MLTTCRVQEQYAKLLFCYSLILFINSVINNFVINNPDFSVRRLIVSNIWSYSLHISNLNCFVGGSESEDFDLNGKQSMHAVLERLKSLNFQCFFMLVQLQGVAELSHMKNNEMLK